MPEFEWRREGKSEAAAGHARALQIFRIAALRAWRTSGCRCCRAAAASATRAGFSRASADAPTPRKCRLTPCFFICWPELPASPVLRLARRILFSRLAAFLGLAAERIAKLLFASSEVCASAGTLSESAASAISACPRCFFMLSSLLGPQQRKQGDEVPRGVSAYPAMARAVRVPIEMSTVEEAKRLTTSTWPNR